MPHFFPQKRVQRRERLVKQSAPGFHGNGAGKGNALLLPAGKLMGIALFKVLEMHGAQRLAHTALQISCVLPCAQPESHVF